MASPTDDQIPPALLRLLADLEARWLSIPKLEVDLTGDEFGGFFTSLEDSYYRRQVRLRVFTAIGNCRSLGYIDLNPRDNISVSHVTEAEATALFQGLHRNPVLYLLDVSGWQGFGTGAACEALAVLVRSSRTLKFLYLVYTGLTGEGVGHIAAALQANTSSILRALYVSRNRIGDGAGPQHLADILASTPTLEELGLFDISMDAAGGEVIAKALALNTSLRWLRMGWSSVCATNQTNRSAALTRIVAALSAPVGAGAPHASVFNTHIKRLNLTVWTNDLEPIEAGLGEAVAHMLCSNATLEKLRISTSFVRHGLEALRHNTSIIELGVEHDPSCTVDLDKLIPIVQSCRTLQRLEYCNKDLPSGFKSQVFRSLKDNRSIKTLVIDGWEGLDNDMFKDLMESLQVNTNLEAISLERTSWKLDGKEATIERVLRYNKRQVAYLDLLHHGDMEFTSPKVGRLFLCGFGFAGKTTLRKSMIRSWSKSIKQPSSSFVTGSLPWAKSRRTQGIEIEMLRDDDTMQVSIWDLAGQDKFRALQSVLFPSISQACVFLFVFSCYDRETHQLKPQKSLDEELRHWMRFIASNWSNQGHVLPQVFVILSHLDKMPRGTSDTIVIDWAMPTITRVKQDFAGLLNISSHCEQTKTCQVFALKSSSATSVTPVLDIVFRLFEDLLSKKLKVVPEPCTRMSSVLGQWRSHNPTRPMMALQEFHDLCFKEVPQLGEFGKQDEKAVKILEAIASYLHDVGTIMYFKKVHIVVVDPNWVSHIFLGSLIGVEPGRQQRPSNMMPLTTDGFVSRSQVEATLAHFLKDNKYQGLKVTDLIGLMLELELCCEVEVAGVTWYLVPHTLNDANGDALSDRRKLEWPLPNAGPNSIHIGCRLQCSDQLQTYLGPGFFSRFQISLRNRLFAKKPEIWMEFEHYKLQLNLIAFHTDGIEVLVEIPADVGDYVDILVRSRKPREQTRAFILAHVVDEIRSFCASPEGSQGVTLVEGILRLECVTGLTLCVHRRGQAVLKRDLIQRLLGKHILNDVCGGIFNALDSIDCHHTWNAVVEAGLPDAFAKAHDLLDPEDFLEVLHKNERIVQQQLISIEEAAKVVSSIVHGEDHLVQEKMTMVHHNHSRPTYVHTMSDVGPSHRTAYNYQLHQLHQDNLDMKQDLRKMDKKLNVIMSMQEQVLQTQKVITSLQEQTLVAVSSKMDEIMNFSAELVRSKVPRRPYFTTDDVGKLHRLVAGMHMSKAVMLHFMCEDTNGAHFVEGQVGLELSVVDAKWKWIQPIAVQSARMLVFLIKAGLHVAAGIGSVIPDFAEWTGAVPLTAAALAGETLLSNINSHVFGSSAEQSKCMEEAWVCLKEELKPHLVPGQMGTLFQLYKVEFVGGPQRVGWVCKKCLDRGSRKCTLSAL